MGFNLEDLPSDVTRVSHFPTPEEILLRSFSKMISMGYSVEDLLCLMPAQGLRQQVSINCEALLRIRLLTNESTELADTRRLYEV